MFNNAKKLNAFTMAEAILVMTVLGIIATIMITTLRPSEFQEKGLQILAKKVLSEIDTATSNVLFNDSADSTFDHLYENGSTNMFTVVAGSSEVESAMLADLYKKYLITVRRPLSSPYVSGFAYPNAHLALKNGAEMAIVFSSVGSGFPTIFPGETNTVSTSVTHGIIVFDTNGGDGPNILGKDVFQITLDKTGIKYD